MADQRITQLTSLSKAGIAANDVLPIADISAAETKKVTAKDLVAAGIDLVDAGEIDLAKLDQASATKLGSAALAAGAITSAKLATDSTVVVSTTEPTTDNYRGRGYFNSSTGNLEIYNGTAYQQVVMPSDGIGANQITTAKLADSAVTTAKVSPLGTAAFADSSVTTAKIADGAITAVKIAADSITTAQIAPNAIGASELADDAVDTAAIQAAAVTEAKLGGGSVTTAKLGDLAVTDAKIAAATISYAKLNLADGSVPGAKIAASSITSSQLDTGAVATGGLQDGAVTAAKLGAGAVTSAKIAADTITADNIAAGAVGTSELAGSAVTYAKIQNVSAADKLLGRSTAGAGSVEEITCTAAGRALLDDADAAAQRDTLGLGTLATQSGTFSGTHSGTTSGTNTGDQTITLTGDVTGSGTGSFAATIATGAVTELKIGSLAVTTGKIADDAITSAKLADQSAAVVAASTPSGSGAFVGQQWLNTNTGIEYTWDGTSWIRQSGLGTITFSDNTPLNFAVTYPDNYSATITTTLEAQSANRFFAGPTSGNDATPAFRTLVPADLPDATASTKGIIQPGTGLGVTSGTLNHTNSTTAGTYTKLTIDAQGHVTTGALLSAADVPSLDASKITSGTFGSAFITDDAVTALKLADYSTAKVGEVLPTADYIGQIFLNPLDKSFFLWDGNVWQPIGISAGSVIFAGTYNANTNQISTVTTEGTAIGLSVGNPLPAASQLNESYYVVVSNGGTGTSPAPAVALAPPDLILSNGSNWVEIDVSSTYVAQTAANVGFTPAANIGGTNVQAALEEVSNECRNADNITSGTLVAARGGTGFGSYTKGDMLAASSGSALSKLGVGTNGQVLRANSATATGLEWGNDFAGTVTSVTGSGAISVANGTTTPAISVAAATTSVVGVVQLSDSTSTTSSVLAATPTAVKAAYDLANAAMPKSGGVFTADITMGANVGIQFEGSTDDANQTKLLAADPTADRTIYLPNADGTLVLSGAIANVDIASGAAIAYSKLALTGSIVNADIGASAAIADTKLATISTAGKVSNSATTATNLNTASAIVARDASGNFTAGTISAALSGNASTATALATARNIQGVAFDGTANITVVTAGSGISVTGTAVANTGVLSVNGSTGAVIGIATSADPTFSGAIYANGSYRGNITAVAALNIDCSLGNLFTKTINGASTFTVSNVPASRSYAFTLELTHTSGTITWFSGVVWPGGTAPTLTTGKVHLFMFFTDDGGTTWRASSLINY